MGRELKRAECAIHGLDNCSTVLLDLRDQGYKSRTCPCQDRLCRVPLARAPGFAASALGGGRPPLLEVNRSALYCMWRGR